MPVLDDLKFDYGVKRIIVVADKGISTGENVAYNILHKNGYVYSQTVRGANADMKDRYLGSIEQKQVVFYSPDYAKRLNITERSCRKS